MLRAIYTQLDNRFPEKLLSELNLKQLVELCLWGNENNFLAYHTIRVRCGLLGELWNLKFGLNTYVEEQFLPKIDVVEPWEEVALKEAEKHVSDIVEWKSGEGFGKVPFEVALSLLTYCIEIIRSDQTKAFLRYGYYRELLILHRNGQKTPEEWSINPYGLKTSNGGFEGTKIRARNLSILHHELLKQYPDIEDVNKLPFKVLLLEKREHILMMVLISHFWDWLRI